MIFWFGYLFFMVCIILALLWWAKRNRQFTDQEHASRLPLEIEDKVNDEN